MNFRHKGILAVIAFLMATTLGVAVAAHGTIIPLFMDSGADIAVDEDCLTFEATGDIFEWQTCGGGGTPGGSNTQVQFNDGGAFGGDAALTYNKTTDVLSVNFIRSFPETTATVGTLDSAIDGGDGPAVFLTSGAGAASVTTNDGGNGGELSGIAGNGGIGAPGQESGNGGAINYIAGNGGDGDPNVGNPTDPGSGASVLFAAGNGGNGSVSRGGEGGSVLLQGGTGGTSIDGLGGDGKDSTLIAGSGGVSQNGIDGEGGAAIIKAGLGGIDGTDGSVRLNGDTYFNTIDALPRNIYQSTDEEVTTTTLTSSSNLSVTLTKARKYKFKVVVFSLNDGATEGIKLSLAGTATATSIKGQVYIYDDTLNTLVALARITSLGGAGVGAGLSAGAGFSVIEGTIDVANGGTFLLQFAQNAAGASAGVHVEVNSSIEVLAIS